MLNKEDFMRYSRQMLMEDIGVEGQSKIKNASVLVIGAGGLGCPVLQYLAGAGIGTIGIADFDKVELHNLHRQILHKENAIGINKVQSAVANLKTLNKSLNYTAFEEKITKENIVSVIGQFDVIVDGSDNFETRYLVNDCCVELNKPLVYGSILNFDGQFAVFNHNGSKQLRDLFPQPPNTEDVPGCGLNGVLGSLPGIVGAMMAQETLKLVTGLPVLRNEFVVFNTKEWIFTKVKF